MRTALFITLLTLTFIVTGTSYAVTDQEKFTVYYSDRASLNDLAPFKLLVLDARHHPPLQPLSEKNKTLLGYISLGEMEETDPRYALLQQKGMVLPANPNWKGSHYIDIRNPFWTKTVVEELMPSLLHAGFDGVFLDTLDSSIALEDENPTRYKGMKDAATHLIQAIRLNYPTTPIMLNRAYAILPQAALDIDMELGESVYADYDFKRKSYGKVEPDQYRQQVQWLQEAEQKNPSLKIYTLDYANPSDTSAIRDIYKKERANGFIPYVATVNLDLVVKEPEIE